MNDGSQDRAAGWNERYAKGEARWDLGSAPPVLERLLADQAGSPLQVIVPGAGNGHDAFAWARAGHRVTAVDFAPLAVASMRERATASGVELDVLEADVTALPDEWTARFDRAWEQTCLCALPVELRRPYLQELRRILKPDGLLVALLWNHGRDGGPPFDMNQALVESTIAGLFTVEARDRVEDSVPDREPEFLWRLRPTRE